MKADNYTKSNDITEVTLNRFNKAYSNKLLSDKNRLKDSLELIKYLCDKFKITPIKRIIILDKPRKKINRGEIHGYYIPIKNEIYIYNLTASTKKEVSIKCFYDTLLHEFMHHYDFTKLQLTESPHTSGFYKRITDLKNKITE